MESSCNQTADQVDRVGPSQGLSADATVSTANSKNNNDIFVSTSMIGKYSRRCLLMSTMITAYLMKQQQQIEDDGICPTSVTSDTIYSTRLVSSSFLGHLSDRSMLDGTWVVVYVLLVRFLLTHPLSRLWDWWRNVRDSTNSAMTRVSSSETVTRIRSSVSTGLSSSAKLLTLTGGCGSGVGMGFGDPSMVISAKEPFLSKDEIAQLSLTDIQLIFRYATEIGHTSFDRREFTMYLREPVKQALDAVDRVTAASGGGAYLQVYHSNEDEEETDIDALHFAAAMRIFAEWRSLRLVPKGSNHRYAFGMGMARRDLIQNIAKIEDAAHVWLCDEARSSASGGLTIPTLRQLLQYEIDRNVHRYLPRLEEKSGASGLLWAVRQLKYQTSIFANLVQVPYGFPTSRDAILAAYRFVYEDYHGFFVKQIFQNSFEAAPKAQEVIDFMHVPIEEPGYCSIDTPNQKDGSWVNIPHDLAKQASFGSSSASSSSSTSSIVQGLESEHEPNLFEEIGNFLVDEWQKLFAQCAGIQMQNEPSRNVMHSTVPAEDSVVDQPTNTSFALVQDDPFGSIGIVVRDVIPSYLTAMQPILANLEDLIENLNMNDPTKV